MSTPTQCKFCGAPFVSRERYNPNSGVHYCIFECRTFIFEAAGIDPIRTVDCRIRELTTVKAERDAWKDCAIKLSEAAASFTDLDLTLTASVGLHQIEAAQSHCHEALTEFDTLNTPKK